MSSINFQSGTVIPKTWLQDLNTIAYTYFGNGTNLNNPTKLTIATVVSPLFTTAGATVTLQCTGGAIRLDSSTKSVTPVTDNDAALGHPAFRWATVYTSSVDSGSTGTVIITTNGGTPGFQVGNVPSAVNFVAVTPETSAGPPRIGCSGPASDISMAYQAKGDTGAHVFLCGSAAAAQFQILCQPGATRFITVKGAVAGDSIFSTSAGGLTIAPAGTLSLTGTGGIFTFSAFTPGTEQTGTGSCSLYSRTGVPNNASGSNGDIVFRSDGGAGTTIYQRRAGVWVGIV